MKFNNLFLVLVLIFVISLGAVSAAEDSDIETGVLATADGMSLDTAVEGDLAEGGLVDESLDSSADADSVDDQGDSNLFDENIDFSADVGSADNEFGDTESKYFDGMSFEKKSIFPGIYSVNSSNINTYFNNDGTLKKSAGSIYFFNGNFQLGSYPFNTFVINKRSSLIMNNATFFGLSFNFTAQNSILNGGTYANAWDMSVNKNVMHISANNVSISNARFIVSPTHDSDYICIDVENANNVNIKDNVINYDVMGLLYQDYFNYVVRLRNSNNDIIQNNTINATLPFKSINYNVTSFPTINTDLVAGIAIENSHGFKLLNNTVSIFGKAFSNYYPTLDAIIIVKSNNGVISGNVIYENDTNYNTNANYLYGIDLYELSNLTLSNNIVTMYSIGGQVNPQGAGAAYPIQITGPVSDIFIYGNNLTTENNGPNIGIYSQNYYGPTNITIYNNIINVTGRATTNYYALVSGIELQDTDVNIYNNTIFAQNLNDYSSNYNVFGVSYYQTTDGNHTFNISDNTVRTNGHYAVYLTSSTDSVVDHNFLKTFDLCCNNAVYAPGASIINNYCSCTNCNCTTSYCSCNSNSMITDSKTNKKEALCAVNNPSLSIDTQNIELYVGPNSEDGDGSLENPYANLFIAWGENINKLNIDSPTNIIINFLDGEYTFTEEDFEIIYERGYEVPEDFPLFSLNENMNITLQAVNNNSVSFKFEEGAYLPLDFYTTACKEIKLAGINLFLDVESINLPGHWAFEGDGKVSYEKCIFYVNSTLNLGDKSNEMKFSDCIFDGKGDGYFSFGDAYDLNLISINYATFYNITGFSFNHIMDISGIINANYNWWGSNAGISDSNVNASIFAVYNTTLNDIGNNQWEVVGKLTWNDGTSEGIERLSVMPVSLTSSTGTFNESNPVLKDGIFKVTYTSDGLVHEINALCDRENQIIKFIKPVDIVVNADDINDGEYAKVTVSIPESIDAMVNITVNNQTYSAKANTTVVVPILDLLSVGNYTVDVVLFDAENNILGSNSTSFEVKNAEPANDTPVTPTKVATKLSAPKVTATYNVAKKLVITLKDANGKVLANKKVSVKVGSISKTLNTNSKGQVSLNVAKLVPKSYTATVKFAGDSGFTASTLKSKVVVKKAKVKLAAKAKSFKAKVKTKKYIVTLKNNKGKVMKKAKLTLKIGKKTYKAKTNSKGKATFKITKLNKKGKKTATVKFAGNKYFKALSKKVKITIK